MKSSVLRAMVIGIFALSLMGGAAKAWDNDGCSNATLNGDYAFTVDGAFFTPGPNNTTVTIERHGVAMTHFDGQGNLSQVDFVLSSPNAPAPPGMPPTNANGFHSDETGTYTVYSDCTGTFTINNPDFVGTTIPGAIIVVKFVLSNHGNAIHTIVSSLTPPGSKTPVPALIHSEGYKLGKIDN
jgi:hypothetical protein